MSDAKCLENEHENLGLDSDQPDREFSFVTPAGKKITLPLSHAKVCFAVEGCTSMNPDCSTFRVAYHESMDQKISDEEKERRHAICLEHVKEYLTFQKGAPERLQYPRHDNALVRKQRECMLSTGFPQEIVDQIEEKIAPNLTKIWYMINLANYLGLPGYCHILTARYKLMITGKPLGKELNDALNPENYSKEW